MSNQIVPYELLCAEDFQTLIEISSLFHLVFEPIEFRDKVDYPFNRCHYAANSAGYIIFLHIYKKKSCDNKELDRLIAHISHFSKIQTLDFSHNYWEILPDLIGSCKSLQSILMESNHLETLPSSLAELSGLQQLVLEHNSFKQIPPVIFQIPTLISLSFSDNPFDDPDNEFTKLCQLSQLVELEFANNQLNFLPSTLNFPKMQYLGVYKNNIEILPKSLTSLTELKKLLTFGNPVRQIAPELLSWNDSLDLNEEIFCDIIFKLPEPDQTIARDLYWKDRVIKKDPFCVDYVDPIKPEIILSNISPPEAIKPEFRIICLNLRNSGLKKIPDLIFTLPHLYQLDISDNQFEEIPRGLSRLTKLESLNISFNPFIEKFESIFSFLSSIPTLHALDADHLHIHDVPKEIQGLTRLRKLNLSCNELTTVPPELGNLLQLEDLDLSLINMIFLHVLACFLDTSRFHDLFKVFKGQFSKSPNVYFLDSINK